jgi:hypothetical protein
MKINKNLTFVLVVTFALFLADHLQAQTTPKPVFSGYKGVMIGASMADARSKLGSPRDKSDVQDYFVFSDNESAQVLYAPDKTVRVISVNYLGKAPAPMDVLGMEIAAKPDGSINKLVRYPKAGFWISYLKTGGDDPMVVITVQKMAIEP